MSENKTNSEKLEEYAILIFWIMFTILFLIVGIELALNQNNPVIFRLSGVLNVFAGFFSIIQMWNNIRI
ncbi:MAG TPA: hypothetical protein VJ912_00180 [Candidatus Nanoarchaeia archaeon]|nr:hypothetical protein [Candidatus Nanoarchaeia archaeon]